MNNKPIISGPGPDTFGDSSKLTTENFSIRAKKAVKRQDPGYACLLYTSPSPRDH